MKALILVAILAMSGCATTGQDWSLYEPYEPQTYHKPLLNSMADSTISIVRTQAEGYVAIKTLTGITGWLY